MRTLNESFVRSAQHQPVEVTYNGHTVVLRASDRRRGLVSADLDVVVDGELRGHVMKADIGYGMVTARLFAVGLYQHRRTVEEALRGDLGL